MADIVAVSADGKRHIFPEGTRRDVIDRVMSQYAQTQKRGARGVGLIPLPDKPDLPVSERVRQGVTDIGQGVIELINKTFNGPLERNVGKDYSHTASDQRAAYEEKRNQVGGKGADVARIGGNILGTTPVAAAFPAPESWLGALLTAGAGGATTGAMMPVENPDKPYWPQKVRQAGAGLVGGVAGGALVKGVSSAIAPKVSAEAQSLVKKGISPTPGQILGPTAAKLEDRLTGIPILGNAIASGQKRGLDQWNRSIIDDVLAPIGERGSGKVGHEGVDAAHEAISAKYNELLPKLTFRADDQLMSELQNLENMASEMPKEQFARFQDIVMKKFIGRLSKTDMMDGQTFKGVESELSRVAKELLRDPSFDQRELGAAVNEVLVSVRDSLERNNPMFSGQLSKINQSFSKLVTLENAAARIGTDDGVFTPSQFLAAVRSTDRSIRKNKFARGQAQMQDLAQEGKKVLGNKYPDSGTAGRSIPAWLAMGGASTLGLSDLGTTAATLAGASLPYTRPGQFLTSKFLAGKRSPEAELISRLLNKALLPAGAAGGSYAIDQ